MSRVGGFSFTGAVLLMAVASVLSAIGFQRISNKAGEDMKFRSRENACDLKIYLHKKANCSALNDSHGHCQQGEGIAIFTLEQSSQATISANGGQIGRSRYQVRGRCGHVPRQYLIEWAKVAPPADWQKLTTLDCSSTRSPTVTCE